MALILLGSETPTIWVALGRGGGASEAGLEGVAVGEATAELAVEMFSESSRFSPFPLRSLHGPLRDDLCTTVCGRQGPAGGPGRADETADDEVDTADAADKDEELGTRLNAGDCETLSEAEGEESGKDTAEAEETAWTMCADAGGEAERLPGPAGASENIKGARFWGGRSECCKKGWEAGLGGCACGGGVAAAAPFRLVAGGCSKR